MTADCWASQSHYLDHLAPVWRALGPSRGRLYVPAHLVTHARSLGMEPGGPQGRYDTLLTAGWSDARTGRRWAQVALMEHGVGQSYREGHDAYAGGLGRCDHVDLFLCPNQRAAAANRAACPDARIEIVGSPWLDGLADIERRPDVDVAVAFHWDCDLNPETACTADHWWPAVEALRYTCRVVGHAHPRARRLRARFGGTGIEFVGSFGEVVRRSRVFVADNTSCLYAAAACGLGVVVLDHPTYRRDVEHGLRFWDCADVGVRCSTPYELAGAVERAMAGPTVRAREIVEELFPWRGRAVERAVGVLTGHAPHTT